LRTNGDASGTGSAVAAKITGLVSEFQPKPTTGAGATTAPRNGLVSGCYSLDRYYAAKPEARQLKHLKKPAEQAD
jgi:hypothetical protein